MKKILLATTMLVAASAAAHAEVTLSGDARMGITAGGGKDATISSRARISFTAAGETDGGLSFGASFRADNAAGAASGTAGSVFISGAFGKLSIGDVDGASQSANGQLAGVGFGPNDAVQEISYLSTMDLFGDNEPSTDAGKGTQGANDPTALYEYTSGAITGYVSFSNPSPITNTAPAFSADVDAYAVGVKYSTDAYFVSAGYENASGVVGIVLTAADNIDLDQITLTGGGTFAGATVKALYVTRSGMAGSPVPVDTTGMGLSVGYTVSGIGLTAFAYQEKDKSLPVAVTKKSAGIGASYDLGGGAAFKAGMVGATGSKPKYDAGITLSF